MKKLLAIFCLILASVSSALAQFTPSGTRFPMFDWHGAGNGVLPLTTAYGFTDDVVSVTVEEGGFDNNDTMKIVLQAPNEWRKELVFLNSCTGTTQKIFTEGSRRADEMIVNRSGCSNDSVTFRKARIFGGMVTMYHMDPAFFWKVWGGKTVTIFWSKDNGGRSGPFACTYPCIPIGTNPVGGVVYDSDARADIAVWRAVGGQWFTINSSNGAHNSIQFGDLGDIPVPMDYDRDGMVDAAVFRDSYGQGQFLILNSFCGATRIVNFGTTGDLPVPGDYDGDGTVDLAVWKPAGSPGDTSRGWRIKPSSIRTTVQLQLGAPGDIPVPGDFNGDHLTDPAVWRPGNGTWFIIDEFGNTTSHQFGLSGDIPAPGDYDGDGKTDLAIWRPSNGYWHIRYSSDGLTRLALGGVSGDRPVPADYDGDGKTDVAIYKPGTSQWVITRSSDGSVTTQYHGIASDIPVPKK
jgi:hypothetical protein